MAKRHGNSMICVCIGRGRHKHTMAEHTHLAEQGAKLVELRLDYISGEVNLKRLIKDRKTPVIISCRRASDGGKWSGTEVKVGGEDVLIMKESDIMGVIG